MSDITNQIAELSVNEIVATISFDTKDNRTSYDSASHQIWEQNGIKVTGNKANSTTAIGDYYKPARFYKNSEVIVEFPNMSKLVIDSSGLDAKYLTWIDSFTDSNATATLENGITTIIFAKPVDSFTFIITDATTGCRAYSMTVYASIPEDPNKYLYEGFINQVKGCLTEGGDTPTGYWERYIEVGLQIGPSEYDYPTTKTVITEINNIIVSQDYNMSDGAPVYDVTYSSSGITTRVYREVYSE